MFSHFIGELPELCTVSYCPEATVNVFSFAEIEENHDITYERGVGWGVPLDDGSSLPIERSHDDLHVRDLAIDRSVHSTTVSQRSESFTKREVETSSGARELMKRLGYLSHLVFFLGHTYLMFSYSDW